MLRVRSTTILCRTEAVCDFDQGSGNKSDLVRQCTPSMFKHLSMLTVAPTVHAVLDSSFRHNTMTGSLSAYGYGAEEKSYTSESLFSYQFPSRNC